MKNTLKILSFLGLALTLLPSFFVFNGILDDTDYKLMMLVGTIGWFVTAPFWIFKEKNEL